ncbi:MAG: DUF6160 family protein [Flavobacteriales bacterium]
MNLCQIMCHTGLLAVLVMPAFAVQAMEPLDEQQLAAATGQDGITIGIQLPNSTISFNQLGLTHVADRSNPASARASLVMAPNNYSPTQGIRFFTGAGTPTLQPFTIKVDADANAGDPLLNVNFALPTDLERIRINPFSVYIADGSGSIFSSRLTNGAGSNTLRAGVTETLRVGTNGIDIKFKAGDTVALNMQLGAEAQGHMFQFTGGSLLQVVSNSPIEVMSLNNGGTTQTSLKLNLDISATDQVTGFRLNGFYGDISANGLVIGKDGWTDKLDIRINNIIAGDIPAVSPTAFNGLANGSMGNIGLEGVRVENLKINVAGL